MTICHEQLQYTTYMLSYQIKSNGSCQRKVQRGFEKPSFQEKTRFLAHILNMSESNELREERDVFFQWLSGHSQTGKCLVDLYRTGFTVGFLSRSLSIRLILRYPLS